MKTKRIQSFEQFHVRPDKLKLLISELWWISIGSAGTIQVDYLGSEPLTATVEYMSSSSSDKPHVYKDAVLAQS